MALDIREKRKDWAIGLLRTNLPKLDEQIVLDIAAEINLIDYLSYNEKATGFQFDMTDLQLVAFAAAVSAIAEIVS